MKRVMTASLCAWPTLAALLAACSGTNLSSRSAASPSFDTSAAVTRLAGCYQLRTTADNYVVDLQTGRSSADWEARLVDRPNAPGNSWSWAPTDASHFVITWSGIDGALTYHVARDDDGLTGEETFTSANTQMETSRRAEIRRVSCEALQRQLHRHVKGAPLQRSRAELVD